MHFISQGTLIQKSLIVLRGTRDVVSNKDDLGFLHPRHKIFKIAQAKNPTTQSMCGDHIPYLTEVSTPLTFL